MADFCCVSLVSHYLNDIPCKNYNYTFVFLKVIPKTLLVPIFFRTRCSSKDPILSDAKSSRDKSMAVLLCEDRIILHRNENNIPVPQFST